MELCINNGNIYIRFPESELFLFDEYSEILDNIELIFNDYNKLLEYFEFTKELITIFNKK